MQYLIPKVGCELEVKIRVNWSEKSKMLKLSIPTTFENANYIGQISYGVETLASNGNEVVAQKWTAALDETNQRSFTCINTGIYGSDFNEGEIRLSLLRSSAYSGHPIPNRTILPQDRFTPRIDQGERTFNFWFNGGDSNQRLQSIDREALIHNEKPFTLSFFPSGKGDNLKALVELKDKVIQLSAFKQAEDQNGYIIRLFNPTNTPQKTTLCLLNGSINKDIEFSSYEIKTFRWIPEADLQKVHEVNLMEEL
jgi:alpha-mannosidase